MGSGYPAIDQLKFITLKDYFETEENCKLKISSQENTFSKRVYLVKVDFGCGTSFTFCIGFWVWHSSLTIHGIDGVALLLKYMWSIMRLSSLHQCMRLRVGNSFHIETVVEGVAILSYSIFV